MGALAARTVLKGQGGQMAGLKRISEDPYRCSEILIPLENMKLTERSIPDAWLMPYDVSPAFLDWCRPLIGGALPETVMEL